MKFEDKVPYPFVLDYLTGVDLVIKPMFGSYAIYATAKLCLFMIKRNMPLKTPDDKELENGVYMATRTDCKTDLMKLFPGAQFQQLKGEKAWIYFDENDTHFETYCASACELIAKGDARIGR